MSLLELFPVGLAMLGLVMRALVAWPARERKVAAKRPVAKPAPLIVPSKVQALYPSALARRGTHA